MGTSLYEAGGGSPCAWLLEHGQLQICNTALALTDASGVRNLGPVIPSHCPIQNATSEQEVGLLHQVSITPDSYVLLPGPSVQTCRCESDAVGEKYDDCNEDGSSWLVTRQRNVATASLRDYLIDTSSSSFNAQRSTSASSVIPSKGLEEPPAATSGDSLLSLTGDSARVTLVRRIIQEVEAAASPAKAQACIEENLTPSASPLELAAWAESISAEACRRLLFRALDGVQPLLQGARTRASRSAVLRAVSDVWGKPSTLALLLLLVGCNPEQSYDEFLSCTVEGPGFARALELDVNVYMRSQRLVESYKFDPGERRLARSHTSRPWVCTTCGIHTHSRWWASRTVVGSITHTISQPVCQVDTTGLPSFAELDANLSSAPATGTAVDKIGSRYLIEKPSAQDQELGVEEPSQALETTDVVVVPSDASILFSPAWYHRVVPAPASARHAAVTFRVQDRQDATFDSKRDRLQVPHLGVGRSVYHTCITRWDLAYGLRDPAFAHRDGRRRGMSMPNCSIEPLLLQMSSTLTPVKPFQTPPFVRRWESQFTTTPLPLKRKLSRMQEHALLPGSLVPVEAQ